MMRRRPLNPKPSRSGHQSKPSGAAFPSLPFPFNSNANALALLLSVGILLWASLCFLIHLRVSVVPTPLADRLRSRVAAGRDPPPTVDNDDRRAPARREDDGLSACLLVNDENPRLPEWIAYHYQVLPLRSLIVAVDPASRSSPAEILGRWDGLIEWKIWEEGRYIPYGGEGACNSSNPHTDCLKRHRKRQGHFVRACMAEHKRRGRSWVLLVDVDEYVAFNAARDGDPPAPSDAAPPGATTLHDWSWKVDGFHDTRVGGVVAGLPPGGRDGRENGRGGTSPRLIDGKDDIFYGAYGSVFTDVSGGRWFLRDDFAFRDALDMPPEKVPRTVPMIKNSSIEGNTMLGTNFYIDDELNRKDRGPVKIQTNWRESPTDIKTIHGGHMMRDLKGHQFYVERDTMLWPPHLSPQQSMEIRQRLPTWGGADGRKTVLDVLNTEMEALGYEYANETIGPCLSMPRVLYGSRWDREHDPAWKPMAPEGFDDGDFVTLRYRWHSLPDNRVNKYQKTIIDMRRIPKEMLKGSAESIHSPVKHYCRDKQPPRYSVSFLRVNHYLDSFEAYSYRNDARADKRNCKKCYDEKGMEAAKQADDDVRPWLKSFVDSVGREEAKVLLAGAGNFVNLS